MRAALPLLLVAAGGALGALARYGLTGWVQGNRIDFPYGTLAVNLLGCLVMGLLFRAVESGFASSDTRLFLGIGVLGGFTTFSSFSIEAMKLLQNGATLPALLYIIGSTGGCLVTVTTGYLAARALWR